MSPVSVQDTEAILDKLSFVSEYVGDCDDWVTVKKQVLLNLPPIVRKNFSTRDPKTKEQWLNDFEKDLIIYYKELTGIDLVLRTLDERREIFDVL
jgi:hypothetical protein